MRKVGREFRKFPMIAYGCIDCESMGVEIFNIFFGDHIDRISLINILIMGIVDIYVLAPII